MMFFCSVYKKAQATVQMLEKVHKVFLIPFYAQENTKSLIWILVKHEDTTSKPAASAQ